MTYTARAFQVGFDHALNQGVMECHKLPEAASQSATVGGDFVYLVDGAVTLCDTTDPQSVYGIVMEDCSGTTGNKVLVEKIRSGDVFEAFVQAADSTSSFYPGHRYGIDQISAGVWRVDTDGTATVICQQVVDAATTGGRILISFTPAVIQGEIGAA